MATAVEVLEMLIPNGGWVLTGDEYEGIQFLECNPISEADFKAGFAKVEKFKAEQEKLNAQRKEAALLKLSALGLELDDLKAIGLA